MEVQVQQTFKQIYKLKSSAFKRTVPPNRGIFAKVMVMTKKADLSKGHWKLKSKLWVATYFQR